MLGAWSDKLISTAEAKIQSKVASFLSLKEPLQKMTYHPNLEISNRAKQLLNNQVVLETKLQTGLALISSMKTEGFDLGKSIEVGKIAVEMDSHIKQAKLFLEKTPEAQQAPMIGKSSKEFLKQGVIGLVIFFAGILLMSKRRTG